MNYPEKLKDGYYRVRDGEKEIGKYRTLTPAKKLCDGNEGSAVYTEDGEKVYPEDGEIIVPEKTYEAEATNTEVPADIGQKPQTAVLKTLMTVREKPSVKSRAITMAQAGTEVDMMGIEDGWLKVGWNGGVAYILYEDGKYADIK